MSSEKQQSRVIWFATSPQQYHRSLFEKISTRGIAVEFVNTLEALELSLRHKRSSVILLSDIGEDLYIESQFKKIIALPDTAGIRLILDQSENKKPLADLALLNGFRDILPSTLSENEWLDRFVFSAAVSPFRFTLPRFQLAINSTGYLEIPACVTLLSPHQIRIETRLDPEIGTELTLRGELPLALGKEYITVKVLSKDQNHLNYRFSQAMNVEILLDGQSKAELEHFIARFQAYQIVAPKRVFIVMAHAVERPKLIGHYLSGGHIVRTAISRTSVFEYPKYFTPELVIIELKFCQGNNLSLFEKMLASLEAQTLIAIVGDDPEGLDLTTIKAQYPTLRFVVAQFLSADPDSFIKLLPLKVPAPGVVEIPLYHPLTSAQIRIAVQLTKLHPQVGELRSQVKIANFSLAKLNYQDLNDCLGHSPIIKTTSSSLIPTNPPIGKSVYKTLFYYCDINATGRKAMNAALFTYFLSELEKFGGMPDEIANRLDKKSLELIDDPSLLKEEAIVAIPKEIQLRSLKKSGLLASWQIIALVIIFFCLFIWLAMDLGYTQMEKVGDKYSQPFINFKNLKERQKRGELPPPRPPEPIEVQPSEPTSAESSKVAPSEPAFMQKKQGEQPSTLPPRPAPQAPREKPPAVFIPRPPPAKLIDPSPPPPEELAAPEIDQPIPGTENRN